MAGPISWREVLFALGGAIIGGAATLWQTERNLSFEREKWQAEQQKLQADAASEKQRADYQVRRLEDATTNYIGLINEVLVDVEAELKRTEGPSRLAEVAGRLVATRGEFREVLREIDANLDGKFDAIASALGSGTPDQRQLRQVVIEFRDAWPAKSTALQSALKKLLEKLGLGA